MTNWCITFFFSLGNKHMNLVAGGEISLVLAYEKILNFAIAKSMVPYKKFLWALWAKPPQKLNFSEMRHNKYLSHIWLNQQINTGSEDTPGSGRDEHSSSLGHSYTFQIHPAQVKCLISVSCEQSLPRHIPDRPVWQASGSSQPSSISQSDVCHSHGK